MARSYWLVNSNRSRVKRFIENTNNKDQFFKYMFIDSGKVDSTWGKEPPVMTTREELKTEAAREEWQKLIAQGWRRTEEVWIKKEGLIPLVLDRLSIVLNIVVRVVSVLFILNPINSIHITAKTIGKKTIASFIIFLKVLFAENNNL